MDKTYNGKRGVPKTVAARPARASERSPRPAGARPEQAAPGTASASRDFSKVSPARAAAFDVLERLATSSAHSDDLLHGPRLTALSQPDRDLTTALVLGTLRWQIALDAQLRPLLSRPDLKLAEPVAIALRLGAFQLLHTDRIPVHAALNESVELVRAAGHPHAAGMANAVLRKIATSPRTRKPLVEPLPTMAERLGHPLWLVQRWLAHYGRAAAEAVCYADQQEPGGQALFLSDTETGPAETPLMDAGSQLVAELAAASQPAAQRVWDCCAAPGGKTTILARRLPHAKIVATDQSPARLRRLADRLRRELPDGSVEALEADAGAPPESLGLFDLVLCDVPCSGTGTLSRNPEIRHRLRPEELRRQAERQARILRGAWDHLAPGGRLLYSTCSLEPEENEGVADAVFGSGAALAEAHRLDVRPVLQTMFATHAGVRPELSRLVQGSSLRTLPGSGFQGDGFFAALFERR